MSLGSSKDPDSSITNDPRTADRSPFGIGDWLVEPDRLRLRRGDDIRKLEPMAMRLLVFLAERPEKVVSRAEILQDVWEGRAVVDETLSRAMSLVRQALGDEAQHPRYIETVPKQGYRVVAAVSRPAAGPGGSPGTPTTRTDERLKPRPNRWWIPASLTILLVLAALWAVGRGGRRSNRDATPVPPLAAEVPRRPRIAVLPFKSLSPEPGSAYIAEGLTEELIHQLAGVAGLRVVSRTSSMTFRTSDATAPEIARILSVDYLLEGTVLLIDQRLRITAQLIQPDQDEHLLSRSYDRDFSEVLDLQREVAKDVVEQTRTRLSPAETTRLTRARPINAEAYRYYLQGRQGIQQRSELGPGLDLLAQAVELDPGFAPAWAALADAHLLSNSYLGRPEDAAYAGAESAISRALELDPEFAPAHASLGLLRLQRDRDWVGSEASYRRAIELEPSYVTARQWYSEVLSLIGRHEEALQQIDIALELDPLSPLIHAVAAQRLNAAGRYSEALSCFKDAEALGADLRWLFREKAWALGHLGRDQEALEILVDLAIHREGRVDDRRVADLHQAVREHGLAGFYSWNLQELLSRDTGVPGYPTWVASAYAGAGQKEEALQWLAKAVQEQNLWLVHWLKNPVFNLLRDDPRFAEVLGDIPPWRPEAPPPKRTP